MVLAQYYNFVRLGHDGYRYIMETMATNADALAERIAAIGEFRLIGADEERLPLVAFQLDNDHAYDEFDLASQLSAERGWMVPACTLPPNADHVKMMPALVKLTLGHTLPRPSLTTSPRPAGSWPTGDGCTSTTARA
jgi:glutamate decarboxylase